MLFLLFSVGFCRTRAAHLEAELEYKNELDASGANATVRRWQSAFIALRGSAVCVYSARNDLAKVRSPDCDE